MNQELIVVILPGGTIQLEWNEVKDKIKKSTRILQDEIFKRFQKDFSSCLLFLGFCDERVHLSVSVGFLREFSRLFTQRLIHTPDLEFVRDEIIIPLEEIEIAETIRNAPFMIGTEYLNKDILEILWHSLNTQFQKEIKRYKGSVEKFINNYSPKNHLVGRVYFHLVENK